VVCAPSLAEIETKALRKAGKLAQQGERSLRSGDLPGASKKFDEALEVLPDFPPALIGTGHISMRRGDYASALRSYELAKGGYAELGLAMLQVESKRYADAQTQITQLQDSISQLQGAAAGGSPPAQASNQIAQLENAVSQLQAVGPPDPDSADEPPAEIDFYIGNAQFRLQQLDDAVSSWEACAAANPSFPMVHNNLALGYWQQGKLELAQQSLDRAEELGFPVNPSFKSDLAKAAGQP
jgi:tetratricopeptide (TPR) repeat protein